jgi:hypothetical protein
VLLLLLLLLLASIPLICVLQGVLADVDLLQRITQASREMVRNWVMERTGIDGRIGSNVLPSLLKWTGFYQDPITRALQGSEFSTADRNDVGNTFKYLEFCLEQVRPWLCLALHTRCRATLRDSRSVWIVGF